MIPSLGTSFEGCYVLVGNDEKFATNCVETLLSLSLKIVAIVGSNAPSIESYLEKSEYSSKIKDILFDSSTRPWDKPNVMTAITANALLGINGGIEYLLTKDFLKNCCIINLHPAPLPVNRGSHHSFWAIMDCEQMGATLHWITEGLDEGPIIDQISMDTEPSMTAQDVQQTSNQEAIKLLQNNIIQIMKGEWSMVEQSGRITRHAKKEIISASTIKHDLEYSGEYLLRLSRAVCNKKNGFYIKTENEVYKVVIDSVIRIEEN
jgi:folate-dependent phosphoribosylglycinamide formyltransferase PurN